METICVLMVLKPKRLGEVIKGLAVNSKKKKKVVEGQSRDSPTLKKQNRVQRTLNE